jgi:DNA helicase-2/ATP-dependent DNA helicase PcrA
MIYNDKQLEAINSSEPQIVVVASPGSGKTHTMIAAIENYLKSKNAKPVVAITFTKKATEDIQSKIFVSNNLLSVATIHSWSLSELNRLSLKYKFRVKILAEDKIRKILKPLMEEYKVHPKLEDSCYMYMMGTINPDLHQNVRAKFDAIFKKYTEHKRLRYLYDFTDLPLYLKDILEEYDEYISVGALFVDEFQDVDPTQLDVFDRVVADKKFFIGDPDQAIYIFRGATKEIFNKLQDFKTYKLDINYRSYQPILDFASSFKNQVKDKWWINKTTYYYANEMKAIRGDGKGECQMFIDRRGKFFDIMLNGPTLEARELLKEQLENNPYQILCRTNIEAKTLQKLGFKNATTIHQAKGIEFKNVLLVDFELQNEEDKNVAYVALTRAKDKLIVCHYETLLNNVKHCDKKKIDFINNEFRLAF